MGMFDTILVPCPKCGMDYPAQTKGGACTLAEYTLGNAPGDALSDVNRHAPFTCEACGEIFDVGFRLELVPFPRSS